MLSSCVTERVTSGNARNEPQAIPGNSLGWGGKTVVRGGAARTGEAVGLGTSVSGCAPPLWVCAGGETGGAPQTLNDVAPNMAARQAARGFRGCFIGTPCVGGMHGRPVVMS